MWVQKEGKKKGGSISFVGTEREKKKSNGVVREKPAVEV